ncbi:unnamed protein product [Linum tenue]|uniref:Uncharacterized protein n=1 Tax=Linum tenue TaxID=586396 RepID=A0AAV0MLF0_9ROSI|nr:unnamed protein product [Linum tenue]
MMRMKNKPPTAAGGSPDSMGAEWEMRPGGMLVQKRNPDSDHRSIPPPTIRVRVNLPRNQHQLSSFFRGAEEDVDRTDWATPSRPEADLQRQRTSNPVEKDGEN